MIENLDLGMVNWARAQFALTAMYHWLFVPLTLGITWIIAFYHTIYVKTGSEEWKRLTKFWMKLFGINFAIGVATGIILEFEFGTNWANYSWMVGDIFGAPLAIEGIFAFFLEATFFAVMFFGWNRVSKGFHLFSTWMKSSSTGVERPKTVTMTLMVERSSWISSTSPSKLAKGPSMMRTFSPFSKWYLGLGFS